MEQHKKCRTFLIEDAPTTEDAFKVEGKGAHERVADAIAELILKERGGKVIGLEGKWGAGKSSVVNLIRKACEGKNFAVIPFDAWAHEGDPLRRTYLETVIRALQIKWVDKEKWEKILEVLAKRISSSSRRIVPTVSKLGLYFALATLFIPLGISLLSAGPNNIYYKDLSDEIKIPLGVIGLGLILSPFLVLALNFIRVLKKKYWDNVELTTSEWAFLSSTSLVNERSDSIQTPEPTSIEFEKYFGELMDDALSIKMDRRILLVLDNLDRVEPKTALEIWSTLQAFVQEYHHRNKAWFSRLWILVPYDPEGLKKIWAAEPGANSNLIADSFFEKSFQIRFQVTPPVLSNWKKYLDDLLQQAMPDHNTKEKHQVYQVFSLFRKDTTQPPTPRQLKLFVNQVGAIHRQWEDQYPLGDIAYFTLKMNNENSLSEKLRTGNLPESDAIKRLGDNLRKNMAGLAFNVGADLGQELLLGDPIYNALVTCDKDSLLGIADTHKQGFWAVLENIISNRVQYANSLELCNAISCLQNTGLITNGPNEDVDSVKDTLFSSTGSTKGWGAFDAKIAEGLKTICVWKNDAEFSQSIYDSVSSSFISFRIQADIVSPTIDALILFLNELHQLNHLEKTTNPIQLNMGAEEWLIVCERIENLNNLKNFVRKIYSSAKPVELEDLLKSYVEKGTFQSRYLSTIRVTPLTAYNYKWDHLPEHICARLSAAVGVQAQEGILLLQTLLELERIGADNIKSQIGSLVQEGHILHHLEQARIEDNSTLKALGLFYFLRDRTDAGKSDTVGNAEAGYNILLETLNSPDKELSKNFLNLIETWNYIHLIPAIIQGVGYKPFIVESLRHVLDSSSFETIFTSEFVISNWIDLRNQLGDDFNKLIAKLALKPDIYNALKETNFDEKDSGLLLSLLEHKVAELPSLMTWLSNAFGEFSKEEWLTCLENSNTETLNLLVTLKEKNPPLALDIPLSDALGDHAKKVISNEIVVSEGMQSKWDIIISTLKKPIRRELQEHLMNITQEADGNISAGFFALYKKEALGPDRLESNEKVVSHIFTPLLRERNLNGLTWMRDFLKAYPKFIDGKNDANAAFKMRLQRALNDVLEDDAQLAIKEIAKALKIEPKKPDLEGDIQSSLGIETT